ncbi:MAG: KH domain-containing protein [Chloroflexi bacterium]|nr:KH domain-containing protein [Chloroflexota bacterium]MBI3742533.1 KH domain-containing protein [Chloroflexota bacterium]
MLVENPDAITPAEDAAVNEPALAQEVLEKILRAMGIPATVEMLPAYESIPDSAFVLNIVGNDLGILIGRRGEALRDLEFITRLVVTHRTGKTAKFVVDVASYRTRREMVLRELAKRMAERVETSKRPITLEAMPPFERRIVHVTLGEHPAVTTQSIGEGDHRRVMILPK